MTLAVITKTIDPVTRLEGHLKVKIEDSGGAVTDALASGLLFRGFEAILRTRDPLDAPTITQRICGVCHCVHRLTSILALGRGADGRIPALRLNSGTTLDGLDGSSCQLLSGWHQDDARRSLWSAQDALMVLRNPGPGSVLIVSGLLPPSARRACNALRVECDGHSLGLVRNYSHGHLEFGLRALIPPSRGDVLHLRFSVEDLYHPREAEGSPDRRGLGFALFRVSAAPVGLVEEFRIAIADALRRRRSALGEWLLATLPQRIAACRRILAVQGTFFRKPVPDS